MAGYRVKWSNEAKLDLQNILIFYKNQKSKYAKTLANQVRQIVKIISKNPFIGKTADIENVRMFIFESYQLIYEIKAPRHILIMLWDCRRNPKDKEIEIWSRV